MNDIIYYENKLNISEIIQNENLFHMEEPFYICDLSDIIQKYIKWRQLLPRVTPFYAVKCNDHPMIIELLKQLGTGFDCASKGEIQKVLNLNINPNRIIFANPTKPISHLLYANKNNILTMTFDSEFELYKIHKYYMNASLVLRIRCDANKAQCPLGEKFGCDPILEAPQLLQLAKKFNLNIIGISFHVGSGCLDYPVYQRAIKTSYELFQYGQKLGFHMNLLDIGGGFPGEQNSDDIIQISEIINSALDQYFPNTDNNCNNHVRFISEPGRYFVASSHQLICKIHSKRDIIRNNVLEKIMYFINDGVYGSFNCLLFDHQIQLPYQFILPPLKMDNNINENVTDLNVNVLHDFSYEKSKSYKTYKSSIWGPTCDALDIINDDIYIPKFDINTLLLYKNMGAYTIPIASSFNGFPLPKIKFYMNKNYKFHTELH